MNRRSFLAAAAAAAFAPLAIVVFGSHHFLAVADDLDGEVFRSVPILGRREAGDRARTREEQGKFLFVMGFQLREALQHHEKLNRLITRRAERLDNFFEPAEAASEFVEHEQHRRQRCAAGWRVLVEAPQREVDEHPQKFRAVSGHFMHRQN